MRYAQKNGTKKKMLLYEPRGDIGRIGQCNIITGFGPWAVTEDIQIKISRSTELLF